MPACDALSAPGGNGGIEHVIGGSDQSSSPELSRDDDTGGL
jgi:hypothetical protein